MKLISKIIFENDRQIKNFVDRLVQNNKVVDLVRLMKPLDIADVIAKDFELQPKAAVKATVGLIQHIHDVRKEGLSGASIETNKQYPVPPIVRRKRGVEDVEENSLARPATKTVYGRPGPDDIPRHHFPPDPRDEPEGWPYDDMTKQGMEPKNKSRKRPLMMGKGKVYKFKNLLEPDLRMNQPGGDGAGGSGIYQKGIHSKDNSMSTAGNRTWSKRGTPGWSASPKGKEFDLPDDLKEADYKDEDFNVRMSVAEHPNAPPEALVALAKDEESFIRQLVAQNSNTPLEVLVILAKDKFPVVRISVAENLNTSPEILIVLAKDEDAYVRQHVSKNSNAPPEALVALVKDENNYTRQRVANNPNTPPEALVILAKDEDSDVNWRVANNPNTPPEALVILAKNKDEYVRKNIAKNPNTPSEALVILAKDEFPVVRIGVAENLNTSPEILAVLAKDEDSDVNWRVANNPNTPPEALVILAKNKDEYVRKNIAKNPNTPSEALVILAKDEDSFVRQNVANNPNTPLEVLTVLANDTISKVRNAAVNSLPKGEKFKLNVSSQDVFSIPKDKITKLIQQIDKFFELKGSKKEKYSWGEFSKFINLNSQPKEIKNILIKLNKNGVVHKQDLVNLENMFKKKVFGISKTQYSKGVQTLIPGGGDKVVQINITEEIDSEMEKHPEFYNFWKKLSDTSHQSGHPVIKNLTLAWLRYSPIEGKSDTVWVIEEIQTDIFYAIKHESVLKDVFQGDKLKQQQFLRLANEFFEGWERALIIQVKKEALKKGINHIFMVSDVISSRTHDLAGEAKLSEIYKKLPQKMGFIKQTPEELDEPNKNFSDSLNYINRNIAFYMRSDEYIWYSETSRIRENKKKIKRIRFVEDDSVFQEISKDNIKHISDYLKDDSLLSFDGIFGNKKRISIPFTPSVDTEDQDIKEVVDFLEENGYKLNVSSGMAEKEVEIPAGPKKGQKQKRKERVGGLLNKLVKLINTYELSRGKPEGEKAWNNLEKLFPTYAKKWHGEEFLSDPDDLVKLWNKKSEEYAKKYAIVISRYPLDVLRMSDFKALRSCHTPGSSHFNSAIEEASGEGLIAYVVDEKSLKKVNLNDKEIFADKDRDIEGIQPIARVRLRRYVNAETGKEIAAPVPRVYGKRLPGFVEAITKWAREAQKIDLDNIENMNDYRRQGPDYLDEHTTDSDLWNNLFQTDEFRGNINRRNEEVEEQARELQDATNEKLEHGHVFYEINYDDNEEHEYFYFGGSIELEFNLDDFIITDIGWRKLLDLQHEINGRHFVGTENIELNDSWNSAVLRIDVTADQTPDMNGFGDFCDHMEYIDDQHDDIFDTAREWFVENEYMKSTLYDEIKKDPDGALKLNMFETWGYRSNIHIGLPNQNTIFVNLRGADQSKKIKDLLSSKDFHNKVSAYLLAAQKAVKKLAAKQLYLPGIKAPSEKLKFSFSKIDKSYSFDMKDKEAKFKVIFTINPKQQDAVIQGTVEFVKFMDEYYKDLQPYIQKAYDEALEESDIHIDEETYEVDTRKEIERLLKDDPDFKSWFGLLPYMPRRASSLKFPVNYVKPAQDALIITSIDIENISNLFGTMTEEDFDTFLLAWLKAIIIEMKNNFRDIKRLYIIKYHSHLFNVIDSPPVKQPIIDRELKQMGFRKMTGPEEDEVEPILLKKKHDYLDQTWVLDTAKMREQKIKRYVFTKESPDDEDELNFEKEAPVGSSIPTLNYGGKTPVTNRGWRAYWRK